MILASCTTEESPPTGVTSQPSETPVTTATAQINWWDEFGEPQYGGTILLWKSAITPTWDTTTFVESELQLYYEHLWAAVDWTLDREICSFQGYVPQEYHTGQLVESWEQTDSLTYTLNIRKGVYWQDKPPVNGREFTAYDVEEHYHRMMGTGSYTEPQPMYMARMAEWESVTATDDYTVVIKIKRPSAVAFSNFFENIPLNRIEAPEWVALGEEGRNDWKNAVGTGPWILMDWVTGSAMVYSKNPSYWGYDERHPENQVPYTDEVRIVIIPDMATAMSALRTGKIDLLSSGGPIKFSWEQIQSLKETNPELVMGTTPVAASCLRVRLDREPFTDIRVRKALQMAINRPQLAKEYYHGEVDGIPTGIYDPSSFKECCFAYEDWPQELKDEYSYNPDKARELLAEAAQDGVFEPNQYGGFDTNLIVSNSADLNLLQIFKADLMNIGVDMEISTMDQAAFVAFANAGKHDQMAWWGNSSGQINSYVDYVTGGGGLNFGKVTDLVFDEFARKIDAASDWTEYRKLAREADKYYLSQHWNITACPTVSYSAWQPYLKGYSGEGIQWPIAQIFARCWIDQDLKDSLGR